MISLGMLSLGLFFGAITVIYIRQITDWSDFSQTFATVASTLVSGVLMLFAKRLAGKSVVAMAWYPLGLLLAFLWGYGNVASKNIVEGGFQLDSSGLKLFMGSIHLLGLVLLTLLVISLLFNSKLRAKLEDKAG